MSGGGRYGLEMTGGLIGRSGLKKDHARTVAVPVGGRSMKRNRNRERELGEHWWELREEGQL